jgi:hypothetical protein
MQSQPPARRELRERSRMARVAVRLRMVLTAKENRRILGTRWCDAEAEF